jgi:hypothetical protein
MQKFSPAKGRRKVVKKFTTREGLWVLGVGMGACILVLVLYLLGLLRLDMD